MVLGKVATVTVTYNRKKLLMENIEQIVNQTRKVDLIIIVDNNGTDNSKEAVLEKFSGENIEYIYLEENIGSAGGFYTGCKYALDKGYEWIILMDDDGKPKNNKTMENLMNEIENQNQKSSDKVMFNSLVMSDDEQLTFGLFTMEDTLKDMKKIANGNIVEGSISPFNGTLISKGLIEAIGFPNKDLFIKGDERDYFKRAKEANAFVATVMDSLYYHPRNIPKNFKKVKILGKNYQVDIDVPWREYYKVRNQVYSYRNNPKDAKFILKLKLLSVLLCKCKKISTTKMILKGYRDGKKGRLGNTIKP